MGILAAAAGGDCAGVTDACAERTEQDQLTLMLTDLESHVRTLRRWGGARGCPLTGGGSCAAGNARCRPF